MLTSPLRLVDLDAAHAAANPPGEHKHTYRERTMGARTHPHDEAYGGA
jgi:hypothetical protein